jgi:hypothetical protein
MSNPDQSEADYIRDWELSEDERNEGADCEHPWHYQRDEPTDDCPECGDTA